MPDQSESGTISINSIPSRRELIREFARSPGSETGRGLRLFSLDICLYVASITGVLFVPSLMLKLACSVLAGMCQAKLLVLAHDAAHESLVRAPRLNRQLATFLFTLIHYNFRLWVFEHHRLHHPNTNDAHPDAYTPFSKAQFDALPRWRQLLERFYRGPNVLGWGVYYVLQRYWWTKVFPPAYVPKRQRASAYRHSALLLGYMGLFVTGLAFAPSYAVNLTGFAAVLLAVVLPFFVFEIHNSFALYAQHTDPRIPWFKDPVDRNGVGRTELISVDLATPRLMGWFFHDIFAHPVHHLYPKIPCYHLRAAQDKLNALLGPAAIVRTFGITWWLDTTRRCKLYDWDNHRWLDFNGNPTTEILVAQGAVRATQHSSPPVMGTTVLV